MAMMTKEEAHDFKARWLLVNEFIIEEIKRTPVAEKLRQLSQLYHAAREFGWIEKMREGEEEIFVRWQILRERLNARTKARR